LRVKPFLIFYFNEYELPDLKDSEEIIYIYEVIIDKIVIRKREL